MLQAAGGDSLRAEALLNGNAENTTELEVELISLVKKAHFQPAMLTSEDIKPLQNLVGDGALEYVLVIAGFNFINRMADLLEVAPEALPAPLRRFEPIRRMGIWIGSLILSKMDLANRSYNTSYEQSVENITPVFVHSLGESPGKSLDNLKNRPMLIEAIQHTLEERDMRSSLDREVMIKVHKTVEAALPENIDDVDGFHARPEDPVEAFAFVGTRYAYRVTKDMVDGLRQAGFDDLNILDLAIAISDANQWARFYRLLGLDKHLFYLV